MVETGRLERDLYHQTFGSSVLCLFNYIITSLRVERTHQLPVPVMFLVVLSLGKDNICCELIVHHALSWR